MQIYKYNQKKKKSTTPFIQHFALRLALSYAKSGGGAEIASRREPFTRVSSLIIHLASVRLFPRWPAFLRASLDENREPSPLRALEIRARIRRVIASTHSAPVDTFEGDGRETVDVDGFENIAFRNRR